MLENERPLILSLETSTRAGGVAVLRADKVLAEKAGGEKSSHSEELLADINEILQKSDLKLHQINLLAIAVGPGSFTGLRIGLSTARALGKALKIPVAGISTLSAAAASVGNGGEICVVLPAGRNEYYVQSFYKLLSEDIKPISEIEIFSFQSLSEKAAIKDEIKWISTVEFIEIISEKMTRPSQNLQILPANLAISVGQIANKIFIGRKLKDYPPFPVYVRGADIGGHKNAK